MGTSSKKNLPQKKKGKQKKKATVYDSKTILHTQKDSKKAWVNFRPTSDQLGACAL